LNCEIVIIYNNMVLHIEQAIRYDMHKASLNNDRTTCYSTYNILLIRPSRYKL
jgi:hypothetical protein